MYTERDSDNVQGLRKIYVSPSGSYFIKTEEIFDNKDQALTAIRKLRGIVNAYKKHQQEQDEEPITPSPV